MEIQPIPITFQYQDWEDKSFDFEDIIQYQEKDKQISMEVTLRKTLEEQYKLNIKNVGKEAIQKVKVVWREDEEYSNENQFYYTQQQADELCAEISKLMRKDADLSEKHLNELIRLGVFISMTCQELLNE